MRQRGHSEQRHRIAEVRTVRALKHAVVHAIGVAGTRTILDLRDHLRGAAAEIQYRPAIAAVGAVRRVKERGEIAVKDVRNRVPRLL